MGRLKSAGPRGPFRLPRDPASRLLASSPTAPAAEGARPRFLSSIPSGPPPPSVKDLPRRVRTPARSRWRAAGRAAGAHAATRRGMSGSMTASHLRGVPRTRPRCVEIVEACRIQFTFPEVWLRLPVRAEGCCCWLVVVAEARSAFDPDAVRRECRAFPRQSCPIGPPPSRSWPWPDRSCRNGFRRNGFRPNPLRISRPRWCRISPLISR